MEIIVDDRERAIIQYMQKFSDEFHIIFKVKRLEIGDYAFVYKDNIICAIERKTWVDLAASMSDGRKENVHKLLGLREKTNCTLIYLIEGDPCPRKDKYFSHVPYKNLRSHLDHLMMRDNIHIQHCNTAEETARRLFEMVRNYHTIKGGKCSIVDKCKVDTLIKKLPPKKTMNKLPPKKTMNKLKSVVEHNDQEQNDQVHNESLDKLENQPIQDMFKIINNNFEIISEDDDNSEHDDNSDEPGSNNDEHGSNNDKHEKDKHEHRSNNDEHGSNNDEQESYPVANVDLLTQRVRKPIDSISNQVQLVQCLPSVGSVTSVMLVENNITLYSLICNEHTQESIASLKYPTGGIIGNTQAGNILKCIRLLNGNSKLCNKIQIRILSCVPLISENTAVTILNVVPFMDLFTGDAKELHELLSGIQKMSKSHNDLLKVGIRKKNEVQNGKKIGDKSASNIINMLRGIKS